ncbi:ComF family protein [Geomonas sp. Red69]|uniref:ComF family protein n=1 Tax=Geomonas diazotrophica TaxID=2843197 RepID=A0ABX8JFH8_9BACT|nr:MULTISPECIES: ComF family protein [Geomonas]MBU5638067.1 ComF family protein [Geomonas diazotrophica]QWV97068.1 ComF family protein [Geomonas nitrogeniifigens]QXE86240.1 ComF family protein [Geomonas nitrogeniifigens]
MFLRPLLDLLFPPLCHACKGAIPVAGADSVPPRPLICAGCLGKISFLESPLCTLCGAPFATDRGSDHLCGACLAHPPFHTCRSAAVLEGPLQDLIHRFKYGGKMHLADPLGVLTFQRVEQFLRQAGADCVVPVPLHRKRLRQRGYNQSQLLAEVLGKKLKVPQVVGNLRRLRWTEPQTGLDAGDRVTNVKDAFGVGEPKALAGKRVLLVDDVFTTGSTLGACVDALREAEVAAVAAVTVARGIPH